MAFVMKADLAGPGVTPASALLAVEGAMPSFELIDFRLRARRAASTSSPTASTPMPSCWAGR